MKTFLIFKREGDLLGAKMGSYQALEKDDTSANRSYLMAEPMACHIELPEGMDADCVLPVWMEEVIAVAAEPERWTKEGEEDVLVDPEDESWTHVPAVEAVEAVAAHWGLEEDSDLVDAKAAKLIDDTIAMALDNAITFGDQIMREFTRENIKMGITADGMTGTVRKNMSEVILALTTGSLYDAIVEAKAIPAEDKDVKYITDERLLSFVNKIETYLGVALSETL